MLVNLSNGEIQLLEIETGVLIRTFEGQSQGTYIIRSCFGGAAENFVLSGSEGNQSSSALSDNAFDIDVSQIP